jgi:hypothetical protein
MKYLGQNRKMKLNDLLKLPKEELAMYILRHTFSHNNLEQDMKGIHIQFLLNKDEELTEKEHQKEKKLFQKLMKMPSSTFEEKVKRLEVYEQYKKLCKSNTESYNKRQKEIDKWMEE